MPLVTSYKMLLDAQAGGYAVGAFNVENMEMAQAVIAAAQEMNAPVIVQTTPGTVRYGNLELFSSMISSLARVATVPVAIHLDHGNSFALAVQAINAGYTSVMIDGSRSPFEENIMLTRKVVEVAEACGIPVEAELGKVGGKEDDHDGGSGGYTDPDEAVEFVERTGISLLAVAIGTAHGLYTGTPKLDIKRLIEIRKRVTIPLVLHGASGLADEDVIECIKQGICKVNFATELRIAFSEGVKEALEKDLIAFDPKKYNAVGRKRVQQLVMDKMVLCGCHDRGAIALQHAR